MSQVATDQFGIDLVDRRTQRGGNGFPHLVGFFTTVVRDGNAGVVVRLMKISARHVDVVAVVVDGNRGCFVDGCYFMMGSRRREMVG